MLLKNPSQRKYYFHNSHAQLHSDSCCEESIEMSKSGAREIKVVKRILNANDTIANKMRRKFAERRIFVLNMMSSPGSGKTTILEKTLAIIMQDLKCSVIVGDICTTNDANRLAQSGAPVIQINTDKFGGDCHLTASAVGKAVENINLDETELLIVENIGNLVCPAEFDIGEDSKVVVLSITEGEDKPAKYPLMFRKCNVALLNKIDLLPYLEFDKKLVKNTIESINSNMSIFEISAKTEEGFVDWINWLKHKVFLKLKTP